MQHKSHNYTADSIHIILFRYTCTTIIIHNTYKCTCTNIHNTYKYTCICTFYAHGGHCYNLTKTTTDCFFISFTFFMNRFSRSLQYFFVEVYQLFSLPCNLMDKVKHVISCVIDADSARLCVFEEILNKISCTNNT